MFWLTVLVAGMVLVRLAPAGAQEWKTEWDKVVAAANAEGTLVLDSQPNIEMRKYVQEEWAKAYPKIALSVSQDLVEAIKFSGEIRKPAP